MSSPDTAKRGARFAWIFTALMLALSCTVPLLLSQVNHTGDVQASSGDSGTRAQTDAAGRSASKLRETGRAASRSPVL